MGVCLWILFTLALNAVAAAIHLLHSFVRRLLRLPHVDGPKSKARLVSFIVDKEAMAEAKEAAAKEANIEFCSTNDVLTYWFLSQTQAAVGLMAVDCRDRLEWATPSCGRQCVLAPALLPPDYSHPSLIREVATTMRRPKTGKESMPACWGLVWGRRPIAVLSNWTKFGREPRPLPDCDMELHVPVVASVSLVTMDIVTMIVYAPRPSQTAVLACYHEALGSEPFVAKYL